MLDSDAMRARVDDLLAEYPDRTGQIITVLNCLQDVYRYLPQEALTHLSEKAGVDLEVIEAMGAFFTRFSMVPVGRYVLEVCDGTACHGAGSDRLLASLESQLGLKEGQTTEDGLLTIRKVHCIGACSQAPILVMGDTVWGRARLREVTTIVQEVRESIGE